MIEKLLEQVGEKVTHVMCGEKSVKLLSEIMWKVQEVLNELRNLSDEISM